MSVKYHHMIGFRAHFQQSPTCTRANQLGYLWWYLFWIHFKNGWVVGLDNGYLYVIHRSNLENNDVTIIHDSQSCGLVSHLSWPATPLYKHPHSLQNPIPISLAKFSKFSKHFSLKILTWHRRFFMAKASPSFIMGTWGSWPWPKVLFVL